MGVYKHVSTWTSQTVVNENMQHWGLMIIWPWLINFLSNGSLCRIMSIKAIESRDKAYDKQWLTYWVIYSFVTLIELSFAGIFYWYFLFPPISLTWSNYMKYFRKSYCYFRKCNLHYQIRFNLWVPTCRCGFVYTLYM